MHLPPVGRRRYLVGALAEMPPRRSGTVTPDVRARSRYCQSQNRAGETVQKVLIIRTVLFDRPIFACDFNVDFSAVRRNATIFGNLSFEKATLS